MGFVGYAEVLSVCCWIMFFLFVSDFCVGFAGGDGVVWLFVEFSMVCDVCGVDVRIGMPELGFFFYFFEFGIGSFLSIVGSGVLVLPTRWELCGVLGVYLGLSGGLMGISWY